MTDEQINITIAEALGWVWKEISGKPGFYSWHRPSGGWTNSCLFIEQCRTKEQEAESALPNYAGDLNDMHEAEEVLTDEQWSAYGYHIEQAVLGTCASYDFADLASIAHATATQRAEAFLRTKGLWKD